MKGESFMKRIAPLLIALAMVAVENSDVHTT